MKRYGERMGDPNFYHLHRLAVPEVFVQFIPTWLISWIIPLLPHIKVTSVKHIRVEENVFFLVSETGFI
jgi:hypothetical protein